MAEKKSIAPELGEAEREIHGPLAEAQALIEIWRSSNPDEASFCCLAVSTLSRLCDRFDTDQHLLLKHGRPAFAETDYGVLGDPVEDQPAA